MILKTSPANISRIGGCTLTGALSVTTHIRDAVTVVHGPKGCTHHNFSLLHATSLDNDDIRLPDLVSTGLLEQDIIFGGEEALRRTIRAVAGRGVSAVFVLTTCIVDTIGDDVAAICGEEYGIPVILVPTAGFLGGTFQNGVNNALCALADTAPSCEKGNGVNIIGERNLEYEAGENFAEVERLLMALGIPINIRFVHELDFRLIADLGAARLNILRDPSLVPVGEYLQKRTGTPFVTSFPSGFSGTLSFLEEVAAVCNRDSREAIAAECLAQESILAEFSDLAGTTVAFEPPLFDCGGIEVSREVADRLRVEVAETGCGIRVPVDPATGTGGVRRMLHRWRCALRA